LAYKWQRLDINNKKIMKKVIAIQMFEDQNQGFVGFKESIISLTNSGFVVNAFTTQAQADTLTGIIGVNLNILNSYNGANKTVAFFKFLSIQLQLFFAVFKMLKAGDVVYINSIYSIAPVLAAKMKHAVVILHFHSAPQTSPFLMRILKFIINKNVDQAIFNSVNLQDSMALAVNKQSVIYNAPSHSFIQNIQPAANTKSSRFHVLMITNSRAPHSIDKLIELATITPSSNFELVLTDRDATTLPEYLIQFCPPNMYVSTGENKHEFYQRADVMIDLSSPTEVNSGADINILQAMYYGVPVIVPTNNGMQELIIAGKHGIAINSNYIEVISQAIDDIKNTTNLYERLSDACLNQAKLFNPNLFSFQFTRLFNGYKARPYDNLIQLFGNAYLNRDVSVFNTQAA
jgi:glycosyltransferase involved in cell wall biosynthesis